MRVALQGEIGSFSHEVAMRAFGRKVELVSRETFQELFSAYASGAADAAVIPVENALFGSIHQNYDLLLQHRPRIVGELTHPIRMCLIGRKKGPIKRGAKLLVHPVAQGQCVDFIAQHGLKATLAHDTAGAVKKLMNGETDCDYAIASALAAKVYHAAVLAEGIQDDEQNYTRFLVASRNTRVDKQLTLPAPRKNARFKTSLACVLPNKPGALFKALSVFSLRDIDLAKIESRPMRGRPFEYMFYLDAMGSADSTDMQRALDHLGEIAEVVHLLGSYKAA